MNNVRIHENTLLNLFMDRLEYWTSDDDVLKLYESYLKDLIDSGCFEGAELDVDMFVDNLYINDTTLMDKEMLNDNGIEADDSEKVLAKK